MITSELEGREYATCRALTDRASAADVAQVMKELFGETDGTLREYYEIFLNLISEKNPDVLAKAKGEDSMNNPTWWQELKAEMDAKVHELSDSRVAAAERKTEAANRKAEAAERKTEAAERKMKEQSVSYIRSMMDSFGLPMEKIMDALKIPLDQRDTYAELVREA